MPSLLLEDTHTQGWTGHLVDRASSRWAIDPMWAGPVRYVIERVEADMVSKVSLGPARLNF